MSIKKPDSHIVHCTGFDTTKDDANEATDLENQEMKENEEDEDGGKGKKVRCTK